MADNSKDTAAVGEIEEREFTEKQNANQMRAFEGNILQGLLAAANFKDTQTRDIEIARGDTLYFKFRIRALTEAEYEFCKKKATKYVRNKQLGITMPEDTNNVLYRSLLIYHATMAEDRKETWDNKALWKALEGGGASVLTGTDVIDAVLMPGEKAAAVEQIDLISGFQNDNLEEVIKN